MWMHASFRGGFHGNARAGITTWATGKLHVVPRAVCTATGLMSVQDTQWNEELLKHESVSE